MIDEMYEQEFQVEEEVGDGENWKMEREQDNMSEGVQGICEKGEESEKGD